MKAIALDHATPESWRAVLAGLTSSGLKVSTLREASSGFEPDIPGKDSYRHRESGASEVLLASSRLLSLIHAGRPSFNELLVRLETVDVVLIDGFSTESDLIRLDLAALGVEETLRRLK
jgi:molybdopterin-guanine dinucleotide biosynthesis protein MobB